MTDWAEATVDILVIWTAWFIGVCCGVGGMVFALWLAGHIK